MDEKGRKTRIRSWIRWILATLLAVSAGVYVWLQTDSALQVFKRLIITAVENNLEATCRIDGISGNLMGDIEFNGVALRPGSGGAPLLNADRMRVRFSFLPLLAGKIWISHLEIHGADVNVEKTGDETWNYEALVPADRFKRKRSIGFFTIDIRQILIADAVFSVARPADNQEMIRRVVPFECRGALFIGREISVRIEHLAFRMDDPCVDITDGSGNVRFDPDTGSLEIRKGRLAGEGSIIEMDGRLMTAGASPSVDIRSKITALSLGEIGRAINLEVVDTGAVNGAIDVKGTLNDLKCLADLEMGGSRLLAEGAIGVDDRRTVTMDLSGRLKDVDPGVVPVPGFADFVGNINAEATIQGRYCREDGFSGNVRVNMGPSRLAGYDISAASIRVTAEGPDLAVETFTIDTPYGRAEGRFEALGLLFPEEGVRADLELMAGGVDPSLFFRDHDLTGDVNLSLHAGITLPGDFDLTRTSGRINVRILPSAVMDIDVHRGNMEASWSGDQIDLERFALSGDAGEMTASGAGSWRERSYRGDVAATLSDLKIIAPVIKNYTDDGDLSGKASLVATVAGADGRLDLDAEIRGRGIFFQDISADMLDVDGRWQGAREDFTLSMDVSGRDVQYKDVRISALNMSSTWSPVSADIDLTVNAASGEHLVLSGKVADWAGPVRKIMLDRITFTSENLPSLVSERPVDIVVSGDRVVFESLRLTSRDASLEAGGMFGFARPNTLSAELALQNFDLQMIRGFFKSGQAVSGRVTADIDLSGFADDPMIILSAKIEGAKYNEFVISEARIRSAYRDARAEMEVSVFGPGGKLMDAGGKVACRLALYPFGFSLSPETLALSASVEDLPIRDLAAFWKNAEDMTGRVSARVNIVGSTEQPVFDASVVISDVAYRKFRLSNATLLAAYREENLRLQAVGYIQEHKVVDVGGSIPMRLSLWPFGYEPGPEGMKILVDVDDLDIADIDALIRNPEYGITGIVQLTAEVGGTINHPLVKGGLTLREGTLLLKPQRLFYENLEADLRFDPDTIEIEEIRIAEDAAGALSLKGVIHHEGFAPGELDIRAKGSEIQVPFHAGVTGRMNPDLRFHGAWDAPAVTGDVMVSRGRINLDILFSRQPSEIKVVQPMVDDNGVFRIPDETPPALAFVNPLRADVTITVPGNVWLRGKDESIEIRGRVNLTKAPGRSFIVYGPLYAVRGTYQFRGKLFTITRGELNFIGREVIDPPLDIQAETRIGDVRIIIYLTGTYEKLAMRFESDPPMDDVDIISYLIFGRPQTSLTEGESFRAGEAALAITGQLAADELRDILGDRFHIDYINIGSGSGGFQHGSLSMGKYITPNVFVIYRHTFSTEDPQQVEVYYEINRNFSLETQVNYEKTSAVDLIWKYEF